VTDLGAPDLVALQEIQDASGPTDDGVVAGGPTFERLIDAIEAAGGPEYTYRQIDPVDGTEGGQPGGNIRVGFLVRPDRLEIAGPPRHVSPDHPCFTGADRDDREPTRRSLALELRFGPRTLFVVDNHWRSKRGDDRLFGATQPPVLHTEAQRTCQARIVAGFVRELLAADPDAWVIVAGDLNEHEFRPPLAELEAAGLVNLVHRIPRADRYTYNFEGNSQVLDHVLVSPGLLRDAVAIPSIAHVNTDLPAAEAASDHDPILVTIVPRSPR
jgi:predicted extracellular nuclease